MRPGSANRKSEAVRSVVLFGANGGLGSAIRRLLTGSERRVHGFSWEHAADWLNHPDKFEQARRVRADVCGVAADNIDFLFANGLTDPRQPSERLLRSNADFPKGVIAATRDLAGCRYVTLGSILERFGGNVAENPYAASKIELGNWVKEQVVAGGRKSGLEGRILHLQLHTLYGGAVPAPHMFLGQMIEALRLRRPFAMSAGHQLREYHHVEDVAGSLQRLLSVSHWSLSEPVLALSSGKPVQLAALARRVFEEAGRTSDLQVGALPTGGAENYQQIYPASPAWLLEPSREPLGGVSAWVGTLLSRG